MALPDIKDAGILAGFVRWGWPYHGLCEGGAIGSSGKTIDQPMNGNAWLVDMGLAPLDMSPGVIASEASAGREWRNYAMISGGQVYGTWLPRRLVLGIYQTHAYIHVDDAGVPWLVSLEYSFPSTNTLRITASIVRFGLLRTTPPDSAVTKTVDVICEQIELDTNNAPPAYRDAELFDVWTNGEKALVGVWMKTNATNDWREVFSAVEFVITGTGGATGSGLSVAASEIMGQSDLTTFGPNSGGTNGSVISSSQIPTNNIVYEPPELDGYSPCVSWGAPVATEAVTWYGDSGGYALLTGYTFERTSCRFLAYDNAGNAEAYRLRWKRTIDHQVTGYVDSGFLGGPICYSGYGTVMTRDITVTVEGADTEGYYLLKNSTEIDRVQRTITYSGQQTRWYEVTYGSGAGVSTGLTYPTPYAQTGASWSGAITGGFSGSAALPAWGYLTSLLPGWSTAGETGVDTITLTDSTVVGVWRTLNCAAFFAGEPTRSYGTIATPLGNKTSALAGDLYFAWQRKTGDFAFSGNPICYV